MISIAKWAENRSQARLENLLGSPQRELERLTFQQSAEFSGSNEIAQLLTGSVPTVFLISQPRTPSPSGQIVIDGRIRRVEGQALERWILKQWQERKGRAGSLSARGLAL